MTILKAYSMLSIYILSLSWRPGEGYQIMRANYLSSHTMPPFTSYALLFINHS